MRRREFITLIGPLVGFVLDGSPRPPREGYPDPRGDRHRDGLDLGRGCLAGMADADRALASAWNQDADGLPTLRSEPRRSALVRQRVGLSRLSRSRVRLSAQTKILPEHCST